MPSHMDEKGQGNRNPILCSAYILRNTHDDDDLYGANNNP